MYISTACILVSGLFGSVRVFQMFQQNSYVCSRYMEWLRGQRYAGKLAVAVVFTGMVALGCFFSWIPMLVLAVGLLAISVIRSVKVQKDSIKPLVFTARVKRMYTTLCLIFAAIFALLFVDGAKPVVPFVTVLIYFTLDFIVMFVNLINRPIERTICQHYINDAKRKLKASPDMLIIGVTGSYGKTSTKFILERLLSEKYTVTVTPESFNTPMGVVRTIREKMQPGTQIFIAEMGAKNVGDIREICDIVEPSMGLITSIGPQHLNTFGTLDNIIKTKFELADAVAKKGGRMFLNGDNEAIRKKSADYQNVVLYGSKDGDCRAENITCSSGGSSFDICIGDTRIPVSTRLLGTHNVLNITGAAAVAHSMGVSDADIRFAVSALKPTAHRLELKRLAKGATLIDDAYNSNPGGCIEAVRVLSRFEKMKKIIVTPGLVELGEKEYECNYNLGLEAGKVCDEIYLVGHERAKPMADALEKLGFDKGCVHVTASFKEAMALLTPTLDQTCVVLFENDLPDNYLK